MNKKSDKAEQFLKEAYATDDEVSQLAFYKKWAQDYDAQMMEGLDYLSPDKIAQALTRYFKQQKGLVLDVGCGTGLTADALVKLGYQNIDGLDYSPEMVTVAGEKRIYRELFIADLNQPLQFDDDSYAAIISSGTFTHGHVGPEPLDELTRILKPSGYLALTVHKDLWQQAGFEDKFENLIDINKLKKVERIKESYFKGAERDGWFCVYQKK